MIFLGHQVETGSGDVLTETVRPQQSRRDFETLRLCFKRRVRSAGRATRVNTVEAPGQLERACVS